MSKLDSTVEIVLDRPRRLRFGFNADSAFEEATGQTLSGIMFRAGQAENKESGSACTVIGFRLLRAMVWAGLRHEDPTLTIEAVGDLLDLASGDNEAARYQSVIQTAMKAFGLSQGEPSKKVEAPPAGNPGGTGGA